MTELQQHIVDTLASHDLQLRHRPEPVRLDPETRWLVAGIVAPAIEATLRSLRLENRELRLDLADWRKRYQTLAAEPEMRDRARRMKDLYGQLACREADLDRLESLLRHEREANRERENA